MCMTDIVCPTCGEVYYDPDAEFDAECARCRENYQRWFGVYDIDGRLIVEGENDAQ